MKVRDEATMTRTNRRGTETRITMTTEKFAKEDTNQEKREREARVKIEAEIEIE